MATYKNAFLYVSRSFRYTYLHTCQSHQTPFGAFPHRRALCVAFHAISSYGRACDDLSICNIRCTITWNSISEIESNGIRLSGRSRSCVTGTFHLGSGNILCNTCLELSLQGNKRQWTIDKHVYSSFLGEQYWLRISYHRLNAMLWTEGTCAYWRKN